MVDWYKRHLGGISDLPCFENADFEAKAESRANCNGDARELVGTEARFPERLIHDFVYRVHVRLLGESGDHPTPLCLKLYRGYDGFSKNFPSSRHDGCRGVVAARFDSKHIRAVTDVSSITPEAPAPHASQHQSLGRVTISSGGGTRRRRGRARATRERRAQASSRKDVLGDEAGGGEWDVGSSSLLPRVERQRSGRS